MALVYDTKYIYGTERYSILGINDNILTMPLSKTLRYFPILDNYEKDMGFRYNVDIAMGGSRYLEALLNSIHTISNSFTLEHMILQKRKYIEYIIKGLVSKYRSKDNVNMQKTMEFFNIVLVDTNLYKGKVILETYAEFDNYNTIIGFRHIITKDTNRFLIDLDDEDGIQLIPPKVGITSLHLCRYLKPKAYYIDGDLPHRVDYYERYKEVNPYSVTLSIRYRYKNPHRIG